MRRFTAFTVARWGVAVTLLLVVQAAWARKSVIAETTAQTALTLLQSGQTEAALAQVHAALAANPKDSTLLCVLGDILFRKSEFESAETAYRLALKSDTASARAHWGLGRLSRLRFSRKTAREHFSAAYHLDPSDPDIILAHADSVPDADSRKALLQRFLALAELEDSGRVDDVAARLQMEERIGERQMGALASPYRGYRFKLSSFFPVNSAPNGWLLNVSIDGGKPLRLVLDTGGNGIVLNAKAARGAAREVLARSEVKGLGSGNAAQAHVSLARTVSIDDFILVNVPIEVVEASVVPGADGIIGADVFQQFLVKLDARRRTLELTPFAGQPEPHNYSRDAWIAYDPAPCTDCEHFTPVYSVSHFLLIRATLDGVHDGYFLLDTGSARTVISKAVASPAAAERESLSGAQGEIHGAHRLNPVSVKLAGEQFFDPAPIAADLKQMSLRQGVEISGTIGYSLLSRSVLTINYRDGLVQLNAK